MAEASIVVFQDQFKCSICLDLLKNPVTINCGHSYCESCITDYWDQDDQNYSCPQCRQTFTPRPVLGKNTMLAEVVENVRKRKLQESRPACYGESGTCDVCSGEKHNAVKSCLVCLESYCQNHLEQHEDFHSRKRHKMSDDTGRFQDMICPQHDKLLEMYCQTEQRCYCMLCIVYEHKTHDTVSPGTARTEAQTHVEETQKKIQQRIQESQKKLQELRDAVETHKRSAQTAVDDTERIFTQLIQSIERSRSEVTQLIRDQEKTAVSEAEGLLKRLEQEIDDLRRRDAELEQLLNTDDHIHFLQSFQSLSVPPESSDSVSITVSSLISFDGVVKSISLLREKLEHILNEEQERISSRARCIQIVPAPEYESREQFLQYFRKFTLDEDTAHKNLDLSEGYRMATQTSKIYKYYNNQDRFDHWFQVLCSESVSGRCYWEVEWSGRVFVAMSYKSIGRKGRGRSIQLGENDQSWSLESDSSRSYFRHNGKLTKVPIVTKSSRIGVYVDHSAGSLSFYSVSDTMMTLIHRVQTTFTQPLYPGFRIDFGSKVKLCDLSV